MMTVNAQPLMAIAGRVGQYIPLVRVLALAHLRERYLGTWAGIVWAFVHPIALIGVFWFVFAQGFKVSTSGDKPFLLLLISGLLPWMAFSEAVTGAAGAVISRAYLVRKIAFPLEVLPATHIVSALIVHVPMLILGLAILLWYKQVPDLHLALLPLYMLALALLATGLGLLLSALSVVFRDLQQGLGIAMNIIFWATPIVWSEDMLPIEYRRYIDANPLVYIIEGYRHALLGDIAPAPQPTVALTYWAFTAFALFMGATIFRRLKPSFADLM